MDSIDGLPSVLQEAAAAVELPMMIPHFVSLVTGSGPLQCRLYLVNRAPLPLLALLPLLERSGQGGAAAGWLQRLSQLAGGLWTLPTDRAVLGLRPTTQGLRIKLDLLYPEPAPAPRRWIGERPQQPAWERWLERLEACWGPGYLGAAGAALHPDGRVYSTAYLRVLPEGPPRES